jgi:hypothetical protein
MLIRFSVKLTESLIPNDISEGPQLAGSEGPFQLDFRPLSGNLGCFVIYFKSLGKAGPH